MKKILVLAFTLLLTAGPLNASAAGIRIYWPNKPLVVTKAVTRPLPKKAATAPRTESVVTLTATEIKQLVTVEVERILELRKIKDANKESTVSFNKLSALNNTYDSEQPGFQPYYIGGAALTDSGTFFAATNIGADSLTGNSAEVSSLSVSDQATFENGMNVTGQLYLSGSSELDGDADHRIIDTDSGAYLSGGGAWTNASGRDLKENFTPIDADTILESVNALPITRWNYKNENPTITHIGPMAEDFAAAFEVGGTTGQASISTIDPAGIALAAIQAISQRFDNNLTWLASALTQFGISIENSVVKLQALVVGSPEQPTGITLFDRSTAEPYCVSIDNGVLQNDPGGCAAQASLPVPSASTQEPVTSPSPELPLPETVQPGEVELGISADLPATNSSEKIPDVATPINLNPEITE